MVSRLAVAVAIMLGLAACGDDATGGTDAPPEESTDSRAAPPFDVESREETFVDRDRERTLVTTIQYPTNASGPVPLIAFSHGNDGHPRKFEELLTAWAAAGYVVAAPAFPLTNDEAPGESMVIDVANQPADVRIVIDEMLALNDDPDDPLFGVIDADRVGTAGLSLGGWTTYGVTYHPCCRDDRIDAAIAMSAVLGSFEGGEYDLAGVPLLIVYGTADPIAASSPDVYVQADPPKYLVTIIDGTHSAPFEDDPAPADEVVREITLDFWDAYLRDSTAARDALVADAEVPGLTELEYDAG